MGGGSAFPAELMKALFNGLSRNAANETAQEDFKEKQDNKKDRKQGEKVKVEKRDQKENEKKKEKVIKVECAEVEKDQRQPESNAVSKYTEGNKGLMPTKDKGEEKRKDREEEKRNQKESEVGGWEMSRIGGEKKVQDSTVEENDEKTAKDILKMMEDVVKLVKKKRKESAKSENNGRKDVRRDSENHDRKVKDEKKQEPEKEVKEHSKKDKKGVTIPVVENVHGSDKLLDKNLTVHDKKDRRKDKGRYNVEKLKSKLSRLDAKMERIAAKSEIYLKKLREAEVGDLGGQVVDSDQKESTVDAMASKVILPSAPPASEADLPEMFTKLTANESLENVSEILYPKLEEKDITGAGY